MVGAGGGRRRPYNRSKAKTFFFFKIPAFVPKMLRAKRPAQKYTVTYLEQEFEQLVIEIVCGQYISPRPSSLFTG